AGVAMRLRSLRNLCFQADRRYVHEEIGWNLRMTNMQAALGLAQIEKLAERIALKRRMGRAYTELLGHAEQLQLPCARTEYAENIYWVYGIVLKDSVPFDAGEMMRRLAARKIATRAF